MPSVLVTGANGFIGSHLCDAFLAAGYDVYGLVRPTADLRFLQDPRVRLVRGDLRSIGGIAFPASLDTIVHAAALVTDTTTMQEAADNVFGITAGLADEAARRYARLGRFVYISSVIVLGYGATDISEDAPGHSAAYVPYSLMKTRAEEFLLSRYRQNGLPVVILRPGDVYGPRDRTSCEQMMRAAERGIPLRVGSGNRKFGLCSPANLCQATLAAAVRPGVVGKAYTVVNGVSPTWREFFDALQEGVGKPQRLYVPVSLIMIAVLFVELARRLVPGLRPSITWYRIRRITTQSTFSIATTIEDLGYAPDNDYRALFASIVEWYRRERARGRKNPGRAEVTEDGMAFDWSSLAASSLMPRSMAVVFPVVAAGLTLIAGPFHHRGLRKRLGDAGGMRVYFLLFFAFFAAVPVVLILALEGNPRAVLASLGLQAGNLSRSLLLCAIAFPVTLLLGFTASRERAMREQYPFSKAACASDGAFVAYEAQYLLLYYTAWEFLYRGLLFFPLLHALGFPAAAALTTALSMMAHIGHPDTEIGGALAGGLVFSTLCVLTGSLLAPVLVHAMTGIGNDSFLYARWHRGRAAAARPQ